MNKYLKSYQVVISAVGPLFVGNGREIGKKEYVFINRSQIGVTDIQNLYHMLQKREKEAEFEDYMLNRGNFGLTDWLKRQNIRTEDIKFKYKLDCGDALLDRGNNRELHVLEFIKDAYGLPYIPGSSLKGMFRTILLGADLIKNPLKYQDQKKTMQQTVFTDEYTRVNRKYYLDREIKSVERTAYRTLHRLKTDEGSALNDIMQGFIISDSEPLSVNDLVLCQKIDRHPDGQERKFPILRECIKPNTEIRFTMTIDTSICKLNAKLLMEAVKLFADSYNKSFIAAFSGMDVLKQNEVLCGGGCGFVSKTIVYPLYGKLTGIEFTQRVFDKTKVPRIHKHNMDKMFGVSPHIIKCTQYNGQILQMGVCRIRKISAI